jgi:integrase/recombinase XerD
MTPLRQRMIEDMQIRNLAPRTQACYVEQVSRFARHFRKSPELLGPAEIRAWQIYLARDKRLAASSISVAVAALRFFYTVTLRREWAIKDDIPTCRQPHQLPEVLSPAEVAAFLDGLKSLKQRMILTVCYATGLRVSEAVRLKPVAIDSHRMVIRVEAGKGRKDRYVMLSPRLLELLREYWRRTHPGEWLFPGDRPASRSRGLPSSTPVGKPVRDPASRGRLRPILCAMHLRSTCWSPVPICARSSSCLVIVTSRRPHGTCASPPPRSAPPPARWTHCK